MKRAAAIVLIAELCLALTASAKTFEWRITSPQAHAETFTAYHGETVRFNPVWSGALSNVTSSVLYYQTNGMDRTWWQADGLTFAPSNDVGAASYRFFVRATDPEGVNYTANGLLRLMESPGFVPNTITPPVAALDFDNIDVSNAPYYTKAETDAKIVELAPTPDLSGYATTQSLMAEVSSASQSATNYTDNVATTLRGEIAAAQPTDYATVSNKAMTALQSYTETDPTIYSWAKAASKPTYSLNEVAPSTENWLGVPGTTAGGKSIKVLAKTVNGVIEGGMTVTGSSNNDNNTTKYRYGGVTATRNGTATDYLFDTSSQSGIVRRSELDDKADATNVYTKAAADSAIAAARYAAVQQLAPAWTAKEYDWMELCTYDGVLYRCSTPHTAAAGDPTPPHDSRWQAKRADEIFVYQTKDGFDFGGSFKIGFMDAVMLPYLEIFGQYYYFGTSGTLASVSDIPSVSGLAPLASPAFTGTPTAPTPSAGDDSTKVATTAFVQEAISGISWSATNTVAVIARHTGKETVSIPSGGNLVADLSGWNDGVQTFIVLQPSGAYTVASNVKYCGYGNWPTNTALCVAWPYAGTLYVNPIITITE